MVTLIFLFSARDGLHPFLLICTSFVVRTGGIVCVVNLLFRLANYKDPCKRCKHSVLGKCRIKLLVRSLPCKFNPNCARQTKGKIIFT